MLATPVFHPYYVRMARRWEVDHTPGLLSTEFGRQDFELRSNQKKNNKIYVVANIYFLIIWNDTIFPYFMSKSFPSRKFKLPIIPDPPTRRDGEAQLLLSFTLTTRYKRV